MAGIWAGTDIGKTHHHCVVLDAEGKRLLSRRVLNEEPELMALLADVLAIDEDAVWAVDVADGMAALWINVLLNHGQPLVYIPGLAVNRASAGYRGTGKTDAKDATVIADQARMRRDLTALRPDDEHTIELRVLTGRSRWPVTSWSSARATPSMRRRVRGARRCTPRSTSRCAPCPVITRTARPDRRDRPGRTGEAAGTRRPGIRRRQQAAGAGSSLRPAGDCRFGPLVPRLSNGALAPDPFPAQPPIAIPGRRCWAGPVGSARRRCASGAPSPGAGTTPRCGSAGRPNRPRPGVR